MTQRRNLSDILSKNQRADLAAAWSKTEAAQELAPLPRGEYVARIIEGAATQAKTGTPSYKLTFEVLEGQFEGRRFWHDIWLTAAAMPMAKRDLAKLGITELDQLDRPLPRGIRCRVKLALRADDDGTERNRVVTFEVVCIDKPEVDPFAPKNEGEAAS